MKELKNFIRGFRKYILERKIRARFYNSVIYPSAFVSNDSYLEKYCVIFEGVKLINVQLGAFSYIQSNSTINNASIGPYCAIASNVCVGLAEHPTSMVSISPVFYDNTQPLPKFFVTKKIFTKSMPRTTIGADVWIGHGAFVKSGLNIGVGSIIGAGSVVTKDVPPYTIVAGNPGRIIRKRFGDDICNSMIESSWWELDEETLIACAPYFDNPDKFLKKINEIKYA